MRERVLRLFQGLGVRVAIDLVERDRVDVVIGGVTFGVSRQVAQAIAQQQVEEHAGREALAAKTAEVLVKALRRELESQARAETAERKVATLERELADERVARAADRPAAVKAGVEAARKLLATGDPVRSKPVLTERERLAWRARGGRA